MINVNQTAKSLDEGIKNLMAGAKLDYEKWSTIGGKELTGYSKEQVDNWDNKTKIKMNRPFFAVLIFLKINSYWPIASMLLLVLSDCF